MSTRRRPIKNYRSWIHGDNTKWEAIPFIQRTSHTVEGYRKHIQLESRRLAQKDYKARTTGMWPREYRGVNNVKTQRAFRASKYECRCVLGGKV